MNKRGYLVSCYYGGGGGIVAGVYEICFWGNKGASLDLSAFKNIRLDQVLFNETAGCFIVEVSRQQYAQVSFDTITHTVIGTTTEKQSLNVVADGKQLFDVDLQELQQAWQKPMQEIFN